MGENKKGRGQERRRGRRMKICGWGEEEISREKGEKMRENNRKNTIKVEKNLDEEIRYYIYFW